MSTGTFYYREKQKEINKDCSGVEIKKALINVRKRRAADLRKQGFKLSSNGKNTGTLKGNAKKISEYIYNYKYIEPGKKKTSF